METIERPYNPEVDSDFIYTTFLKSFRDSGFARGILLQVYEKGQRYRIKRILADPNTKVVMLVDPQDTDVIYAYMIYSEPNLIHYIFTKAPFRKLGLAKKLISRLTSPYIYTHKTNIEVEQLLHSHPILLNSMYNPYLLP